MIEFILRELKALLKDSGFILLAFGGPLFYSFFYPFPYAREVARQIPVAVVDQDNSVLSRQLVRMMRAEEEIFPVAYPSLSEAKKALDRREVFAVVSLDEDFERDILKQVPKRVHIYTDASYPVYYKQATTALQKAIKTVSAGVEIKKLQSLGAGKAAVQLRSPIKMNIVNLYNPLGSYSNYVVPAVFVAMVHQIMLIVIGLRAGTLYERKKEYSKRLKPFKIWLGKMAAFLLFMAGYFVYLFIIMYRLYGFSGGERLLEWFLFYMIFAVATIGLGLTIGGLFKERETPIVFIVVTSLPLLFMSGIIWPVWKMPLAIQALRLCVPMTYGINGAVRLFVMNVSLGDILPYIYGCSILSILFGFTSYLTIKKRYPLEM